MAISTCSQSSKPPQRVLGEEEKCGGRVDFGMKQKPSWGSDRIKEGSEDGG